MFNMNAGIMVENSGKRLVNTNFWDTDIAKNGHFYLSTNAACLRLLMPEGEELTIKEMVSSKYAILSRAGNAFELVFEDDSKCPYTLIFDVNSMDRIPPESEHDTVIDFAIYSLGEDNKPELRWESRVYYRLVDYLPYLKPLSKKEKKQIRG